MSTVTGLFLVHVKLNDNYISFNRWFTKTFPLNSFLPFKRQTHEFVQTSTKL